jgi:hypothetical protein
MGDFEALKKKRNIKTLVVSNIVDSVDKSLLNCNIEPFSLLRRLSTVADTSYNL